MALHQAQPRNAAKGIVAGSCFVSYLLRRVAKVAPEPQAAPRVDGFDDGPKPKPLIKWLDPWLGHVQADCGASEIGPAQDRLDQCLTMPHAPPIGDDADHREIPARRGPANRPRWCWTDSPNRPNLSKASVPITSGRR